MLSPAAWIRPPISGIRGVLACCAFISALPLNAELLYSTDFETFPAGPDQWSGTEGWSGTSTGVGVHGIDQDILPPLGKTAFLGVEEPASTFVSVAKPFNYDPATQGNVGVYVETLLGIEDSTNGKRDHFYLSFYNSTGGYLASILFSNHPTTYGIWRLDGVSQIDTTIDFIIGELHLITVNIDLASNTWSAEMDGIPLFNNATFTATARSRDFGPVAYEWQLSGSTPADHGNNWMLIADFAAFGVPPGEGPFVMDTIGLSPTGEPSFSFTGEPGWDYQVEYSQNGFIWRDDLPGSFYTGIPTQMQIQFNDPTPQIPPGRFYRVVRFITP